MQQRRVYRPRTQGFIRMLPNYPVEVFHELDDSEESDNELEERREGIPEEPPSFEDEEEEEPIGAPSSGPIPPNQGRGSSSVCPSCGACLQCGLRRR